MFYHVLSLSHDISSRMLIYLPIKECCICDIKILSKELFQNNTKMFVLVTDLTNTHFLILINEQKKEGIDELLPDVIVFIERHDKYKRIAN